MSNGLTGTRVQVRMKKSFLFHPRFKKSFFHAFYFHEKMKNRSNIFNINEINKSILAQI